MISPLRLLGLAVLTSIFGCAALAFTRRGTALGPGLAELAHAAFAPNLWRALLVACAASVGLCLGVQLLSRLRARRRDALAPALGALDGRNVRQAIEEVRRRLVAYTSRARPDVVGAFEELVRGAVSVSASDIHVSPTPEALRLTYRVHGSLHDVAVLPSEFGCAVATRVKVLARLDTYVRGTPQDGRLVCELDGDSIEARVSTLPTELGERIVLRLVRGGRTVPELGDLGFSRDTLDRLRELLSRPQGLLFVTGPVGSGKTTTLYTCMRHIAEARGRTTTLVTLEDPIELQLPFATQTQVHPRAGLTFASVLRSVLRQDPNVLMLGEIRDRETAEIAMQAGLTGHLILTTVHGESAAGSFARLVDVGIEPFILASATIGSLSQRLVRTLCEACRKPAEPEPIHIDRFARHDIQLPHGSYYEAVGCDACEGQGFVGRLPIAELLIVNPELRQAINQRRATGDLQALAAAHGMKPLLRDGLERAQTGATSLTEVLRVAG
jgi:general secretion pathway protein E